MVYMHANVINQLYHGCAHVRTIMHSLTLVHYRIVHAHEPWYNLDLTFKAGKQHMIIFFHLDAFNTW